MRRMVAAMLATVVAAAVSGCAANRDATPPIITSAESPAVVEAAPVSLAAGGFPTVLPWPTYTTGDYWLYSDGYGLEVEATTGSGRIARMMKIHAPSQYIERRGLFREVSLDATTLRRVVFRSEDPDQFMTLPVGEPLVFLREYMADDRLIRHTTSWVKEGVETITVPAGTFQTVVLTMRTRSLVSSWTGFERWWYSPRVGNYVRMEYRYGNTSESSRVLVEFGPSKPPS